MKFARVLSGTVLLCTLSIIRTGEVWAQRAEMQAFAKNVRGLMPGMESDISALAWDAWLLAVFAACIGIFGLVSGITVGTAKSKRMVSYAAGILAAVLTLVTNTFYEVDHRVLFAQVKEARSLYRGIEREVGLVDTLSARADLEAWRTGIDAKIDRVYELTGVSVISLPFLSKVFTPREAHAEGAVPDWVERVPTGKGEFFVVGRGEGATFQQAKAAAEQDAQAKARQALQKVLTEDGTPVSPQDLPALLDDIAVTPSVEDTYVKTGGAGASQFTFYVLGRVSLNVVKARILRTTRLGDRKERMDVQKQVQQVTK